MKTTQQKTNIGTPTYVTEGVVREIVDDVVREAVREQARALERHLGDIHQRLQDLETTTRR